MPGVHRRRYPTKYVPPPPIEESDYYYDTEIDAEYNYKDPMIVHDVRDYIKTKPIFGPKHPRDAYGNYTEQPSEEESDDYTHDENCMCEVCVRARRYIENVKATQGLRELAAKRLKFVEEIEKAKEPGPWKKLMMKFNKPKHTNCIMCGALRSPIKLDPYIEYELNPKAAKKLSKK